MRFKASLDYFPIEVELQKEPTEGETIKLPSGGTAIVETVLRGGNDGEPLLVLRSVYSHL